MRPAAFALVLGALVAAGAPAAAEGDGTTLLDAHAPAPQQAPLAATRWCAPELDTLPAEACAFHLAKSARARARW
jgi:hypothetical protein